MRTDQDGSILKARQLCHRLYRQICVDQKRMSMHKPLLKQRPHWSILKREEQFEKIDLGDKVPFDIALPLPAKDPGIEKSEMGVKLFWEKFQCQKCGRCCYTPGAGLYLEKEDFDRIAEHLGSRKKLKSICRYDKDFKVWVLKQPCPFYDMDKRECSIYSIRPQTCTKYPLHPPLKEMPYNLAVDAFCPAARQIAKDTLGWWIICENNWARILSGMESMSRG